MADTIKFIIPGKPEYLTMVRLALGSIADTAGFNFEEIKKIEQQFEMGIITKEEKDEKINAILNA